MAGLIFKKATMLLGLIFFNLLKKRPEKKCLLKSYSVG